MFGTSGVRGRVGTTVTADLAVSIGRAVATAGAERVVLGRDGRTTGPMLRDAVSAGLRECRADVLDVGTVTTPTLARSVRWLDADVGVMVTASHNPPEDNGFELWTPSGKVLGPEGRRSVETIVEEEAYRPADWISVGETREPGIDVRRRHEDRLVAAAGDCSDLSVVVDAGNGVGRITADALSRAGCSVRTVDGQLDGRFPGRASDPTAESLSGLGAFVAATDADLGVAHDGDADRTLAVDGDGRFVAGDDLLALFARRAAGEGDRVAVPVDASMAVEDALEAVGAGTVRTRVGDVHVAEAATGEDVVFGGEPSGAWIWPDETLCPDGPLAACRLAAMVHDEGPLADLVAELPEYPLRRESVVVDDPAATMERVASALAARFDRVTGRDGVRVESDDGWLLVRASGTQPLLRVTAEGTDADRAAALLSAGLDLVREYRTGDPDSTPAGDPERATE